MHRSDFDDEQTNQSDEVSFMENINSDGNDYTKLPPQIAIGKRNEETHEFIKKMTEIRINKPIKYNTNAGVLKLIPKGNDCSSLKIAKIPKSFNGRTQKKLAMSKSVNPRDILFNAALISDEHLNELSAANDENLPRINRRYNRGNFLEEGSKISNDPNQRQEFAPYEYLEVEGNSGKVFVAFCNIALKLGIF